MRIDVLDKAIKEELQYLDSVKDILFLEQHKQYPSHFAVNCFDPFYIHKLQDVLGYDRSLAASQFERLITEAEDNGYSRIIFTRDPKDMFRQIEHIHDPLPIELNKELYRFQLEGFNFSKDQLATIFVWSTGVGKSVIASAKIKYLLENNLVDKVVIGSKNHNKHNWKKQILETANWIAEVVESPGKDAAEKRERREEIYHQADIFIINYEKLRMRDLENPQTGGDGQEILSALKGKRVFFVLDEGPSKLGNMKTQTWKGLNQIMKSCKEVRQIWLSATPIEKDPENVFSFVKLIDPDIFGTKSSFIQRYAQSMSPFGKYQVAYWNTDLLPELGLRLAHITHRANRFTDPEIAGQFPERHIIDIDVDWSDQDRKLYNDVTGKITNSFLQEQDDFGALLAQIQILQHVCNNPLVIKDAQGELATFISENVELTDKHCTKLEVLKQLIEDTEGKIILFSAFNLLGSQMLSRYLDSWGITHVLYTGKQSEEDHWKQTDTKVFLSSDLGSDSLNLKEAQTVINYDLPWKFTTEHQRDGRHDRIDSTFDHVFIYNLLMVNSIEIRKKMVIARKESFQQQIFDGVVADQSESLGLTKKDLYFILTGRD